MSNKTVTLILLTIAGIALVIFSLTNYSIRSTKSVDKPEALGQPNSENTGSVFSSCPVEDTDSNIVKTQPGLNLSLKLPQNYTYEISSYEDKDWAIEIITPNKVSLIMSVGAQFTNEIGECGFVSEKCNSQNINIGGLDFNLQSSKETNIIASLIGSYQYVDILINLDNTTQISDQEIEEIETVLSCMIFQEN